jgi:hypothetical protein
MNRKNLFAIAVVGTSLLASPLVYAAPAGVQSPLHAMFRNQTKPIKLNVRNDSNAAIELKVNDQIMTVEAGKTLDLKVPVGTRILANKTTPNHPAGSLITEVIKEQDGATISIR